MEILAPDDTSVDRAARAPLPVHSEHASAELHRALEDHGVRPDGTAAWVWRQGDRLHIAVVTPQPFEDAVAREVTERLPVALCDYDPWAPGFDVSITVAGCASA